MRVAIAVLHAGYSPGHYYRSALIGTVSNTDNDMSDDCGAEARL
jgi:hypothetical protein